MKQFQDVHAILFDKRSYVRMAECGVGSFNQPLEICGRDIAHKGGDNLIGKLRICEGAPVLQLFTGNCRI